MKEAGAESEVLSFDDLLARQEARLARLPVHALQASKLFDEVAHALDQRAVAVGDAVLRLELRERPPLNVSEVAGRLDRLGAAALTAREHRALIGAPEFVTEDRLTALLVHAPHLAQHIARIALRAWPRFVGEDWGDIYASALILYRPQLHLPLLNSRLITSEELWSRRPRSAESLVAQRAGRTSLGELHDLLRHQLGVRDSWLFMPSVLMAWLAAAPQKALDSELRGIFENKRLLALLFPSEREPGEPPPPAARHLQIQVKAVACFVKAGFTQPAQIDPEPRETLVAYLLRSDFGDPRTSSLSDGWMEVREECGDAFSRMLSKLSEQDLEVFFAHAMNEPDRRRFWLRYLPAIERTGCVLSAERRAQLEFQVHARPELKRAVSRAYAFRYASEAQAFYLVFREHAVVEFSVAGNAAYIYARADFESAMEPAIHKNRVGEAADLKDQVQSVGRILHSRGWQSKAEKQLSELGIHPRGK